MNQVVASSGIVLAETIAEDYHTTIFVIDRFARDLGLPRRTDKMGRTYYYGLEADQIVIKLNEHRTEQERVRLLTPADKTKIRLDLLLKEQETTNELLRQHIMAQSRTNELLSALLKAWKS